MLLPQAASSIASEKDVADEHDVVFPLLASSLETLSTLEPDGTELDGAGVAEAKSVAGVVVGDGAAGSGIAFGFSSSVSFCGWLDKVDKFDISMDRAAALLSANACW